MDRISLQFQAQETEGDRQTVHTNYRFALLQNVIQSTNKPGWVARSHRKTPDTDKNGAWAGLDRAHAQRQSSGLQSHCARDLPRASGQK